MKRLIPHFNPTRDEYIGTVYGSAAMSLITELLVADALDAIKERTDYHRRNAVRLNLNIARFGMADVRKAVNAMFLDKDGVTWTADFGNAAYSRVEPHTMRLQFAIANALGRFRPIEDTNAVAKLIVAQCMAHESAAYTERRAGLFKGCTMENRHGSVVSVPNVIRKMSCADVDNALRNVATLILKDVLPKGFSLLDDTTVRNGCRIVMNTLGDVNTWIYARDKADELNGRKGQTE